MPYDAQTSITSAALTDLRAAISDLQARVRLLENAMFGPEDESKAVDGAGPEE